MAVLTCPKCKSTDVKKVHILGGDFLMCNNCGYDESEEILDVYPEGRNTQKGKSGYSPYKAGGGRRSVK